MIASRRRLYGLIILNAAAALVIVGALYDLLVPAVPANHRVYLGNVDAAAGARFARLDLAMLRSIGGCLLAIGMTCLLLINGPVRRGDGWARVAVLLLIGVAETNNAYRMYPFASPWYGPLGFAILAAAGTTFLSRCRSCCASPASESGRIAGVFPGTGNKPRMIRCAMCG